MKCEISMCTEDAYILETLVAAREKGLYSAFIERNKVVCVVDVPSHRRIMFETIWMRHLDTVSGCLHFRYF
jgi:hypothetical protein